MRAITLFLCLLVPACFAAPDEPVSSDEQALMIPAELQSAAVTPEACTLHSCTPNDPVFGDSWCNNQCGLRGGFCAYPDVWYTVCYVWSVFGRCIDQTGFDYGQAWCNSHCNGGLPRGSTNCQPGHPN